MHYQRHLTLAPLALAACLLTAPVCTAAPARAAAAAPAAALPADIAQRPIAGNVTIARPDFGRELPAEVNKKLISEVTFRLAPA